MKLFLFNSLFFLTTVLTAQELELKEQKTLKSFVREQVRFSGSLGAHSQFIHTDNDDDTRDPASAGTYLNFNLGLWKFEMPLQFTLTTDNFTRSQQLKFIGIQPTWKWIKFSVWDFDFKVSDLTGSGTTVRGGGIDLEPGPLRTAFYYGKIFDYSDNLLKPKTDGFDSKRYAQAGKIGLEFPVVKWNTAVVHIEDRNRTVLEATDTTERYTPQENLVVETDLTLNLLKKRLTLSAEGAASLFSDNTTEDKIDIDMPEFTEKIFKIRENTRADFAVKTRASLKGKVGSMRLFYNYFGPGFITMGVASSSSDLMAFGGNGYLRIEPVKSMVSSSVNYQQDNIAETKSRTMKRMQLMNTLVVHPATKLSFDVRYSRNSLKNAANLDSMIYYADSIAEKVELFQSYNDRYQAGVTYTAQGDRLVHAISLSGAVQVSQKDIKSKKEDYFDTQLMNSAYSLSARKINSGVTYNLTRTAPVTGDVYVHSIGLNGGYNPVPQWRNSGAVSVQKTESNNSLNVSLSSRYTLRNHHTFVMKADRVDLFDSRDPSREFAEMGFRIGYVLTF